MVAVNDGGYGISRFVSSKTLFADDTAIGNDEAGFYVGDSPHADTVVRNDRAFGNQFGIFIRHARHVLVTATSSAETARASWSSTTGSAAARAT